LLLETRLEGARLAHVDTGEGEPVLLLHGYPQSHRAWRFQIGPLAARHRVIAPDWFGWGRSERTERLSTRYDDEVERIGALLDALGMPAVNLIAHDYGGFLGLGFLARHPQRVLRFGILNSRAHRTFPWPSYLPFGLIGLASRGPGLRRLVESLPLYAMHRRGLAPYVRRGCFSAGEVDGYIGWMATAEGRRWFAHFYSGYDVRTRPGLRAALPGIRCPTAAVWGDRDPFCPLAIAEEFASLVPGARLHRIRGGHFIMEERPDEVLGAIEDLLTRA
jgi:pimeloyl-ACP methyl ester carboxylesterase